MSHFGKRFQAGVDIWECKSCNTWNFSGKVCKCGRTNADELIEKSEREKKETMENNEIKERKKLREPSDSGEFIKSYFFPEKK